MSTSKWFVSTDEIGKPGVSPKVAGPFSTREDALSARQGMEKLYGNYSVFEEKDRPLVGIPRVPGLGWLKGYGESKLAVWVRGREGLKGETTLIYRVLADIEGWTPATAVPTAALDELRANPLPQRDIRVFLAAVDEANA
jgi:hypothetical protein